MSTIQIVGIAVAAVIVVLLVVGLIVTRKPGEEDVAPSDESARSSLFDTPPSDTLAKLGAPEYVPAEPPVAGDATASGRAPTSEGAASGRATRNESAKPERGTATGERIGLDWGETAEPPMTPAQDTPAEGAPGDAETTGEMAAVGPVAEPPVGSVMAAAEPPSETMPAQSSPEAPATGAPAAEESTPPAPASRLVPLSSIIVTTSTKMVDLDDPDIKRMLTDLVTFEIDQATQFRAHGQDLDAILQLTEAEKICRALGREDTARQIHDMMQGLRA